MIRKVLSFTGCPRTAGNENDPRGDDTVPVADVRALATEAALATAIDASPAVLVTLWAHDQRLHPTQRSPRRRAS